MDDNQRWQWEHERAKGKWRFIVVRSLVSAVGLLVIDIAGSFFFDEGVPFRLTAYVVGGIGLAVAQWYLNEASYRNSSDDTLLTGRDQE
jgi:hypothetical protein